MNNTRHYKIIIWTLITLFAAVTVFSIFWTPFDREKLFRSFPANALLVGSSHHPDLFLEKFVTNTFLKAVIDSSEIAELSKDNPLIRRVVASRITYAYAPSSPGASAPVLALTSWLGGWTGVFRWALWIHQPKGLAPVGECYGRRLWVFKKPITIAGTPHFLSFAFEEGILIACLSREQDGITRLLRNYDGQGDSIVNTAQWEAMEKSFGPDRIWLRFSWPSSGCVQHVLADCAMDMCDTNGFAASIRFKPDIIPSVCLSSNRTPPETGKMCLPSPAIMALLPSEMVSGLVNGLALPSWAAKVNAVLVPVGGKKRVCMFMVYTGAYGGRYGPELFRIAVPAILLAVSDCRVDQTGKDISGLLDLINARYHAGLIINPQVAPAGRQPVSVVESVSVASLLGSMPEEDRPAFCFYQKWLLLASNGSSLRNIVADIEAAAVDGTGDGLWLNKPDIGGIGSFVICDPESGGRVLRLAITGLIFMLERERSRSNDNTVKILRVVRSWLEQMDRLENCRLWFESEGGGAVARIEIGKKRK